MSEEPLTLERVAHEVLKCKQNFHERVSELEDDIGSIKVDLQEAKNSREKALELQKQINHQQEEQNQIIKEQRETLSQIRQELKESKERFSSHDVEEMEKYREIVVAINSLEAKLETYESMSELVKTLNQEVGNIANNGKWTRNVGWGALAILASGIVILFTFANIVDKILVRLETKQEGYIEKQDTLNNNFKEFTKEMQQYRMIMEKRMTIFEKNQERNYGQILGRKSKIGE